MSFKSIVEWVTIHNDLNISIENIESGKYTSSYMTSLVIDFDVVQEFIFHNKMKKKYLSKYTLLFGFVLLYDVLNIVMKYRKNEIHIFVCDFVCIILVLRQIRSTDTYTNV